MKKPNKPVKSNNPKGFAKDDFTNLVKSLGVPPFKRVAPDDGVNNQQKPKK